ncbi:hypothetical protein [Caulobacter sp. LARHSG274]
MARTPDWRSLLAAAGLAVAGATAAVAGSAPQPLIYGAAPPIYSYGVAGEAARMPMALTETPPTAMEGEIARDGVIAQHTLRVAQARVLTSPAQGRFRQIPAGAVLARVEIGDGPRRVVWCDLRANLKWVSRRAFECLTDTKETGAFDQSWAAASSYYFAAADFNVVRDPHTLVAKPAYREARPEERPTLLLGYQWCDGDGVVKPARFARALRTAEDKGWFLNGGACAQGRLAPLGGGDFALETLNITLSPGAQPGTLHYRVTGRLPAVADLKPIAAGLADLAATGIPPPKPASLQQASPPDFAPRPLVSAGAPPAVAVGGVAKGQPFFTVGVRHGVTGVLKQEVRGKGWFFDKALPAGQPVYGVPMAGAGAAGLVWCAPRLEEKPRGKSPTRWAAACLPQNVSQANWVEAQTAMMSVNLSWYQGSRTVSAVAVEPGPIDLPAMTLTYVFGGWSEQGSLLLDVRLDWGEGPQLLRSLRVAPGADGVVTIKTMDGVIGVRRADAAARAEMLKAFRPEGDVVY